MKIFLDSADITELEEAYSTGVIDGVTTNPSLIKKAAEKHKGPMEDYVAHILSIAKGTPVSLEVVGTKREEMVMEGLSLYKRFKRFGNVVIKIPVCTEGSGGGLFDGLKAIGELRDRGIAVNCTLVFSPEQALLAAKAGARYVSPFVGRMDDYLREEARIKFSKEDYYPQEGIKKGNRVIEDNGIVSGSDLIWRIHQLFAIHGVKCEILAASIRSKRQFHQVGIAGAHIATVPFDIFREMIIHPKTNEGVKGFVKDSIPEYKKLLK